ncbi:MAG: hypothetical protein ACQERS_12140 [Bacteroidota bacterium]
MHLDDLIQLNTLDRPGTVADTHASSHEDLKKMVDHCKPDNIEIIAAAPEKEKYSFILNINNSE